VILSGVCTPPLPCWKPGIGNVFSNHHTAPAGVLGTDNTIKVQVQKLKAGQLLPRLGKSHCLLWQMPVTSLVTKWKNKGLGAKHVLYTLLAPTYLCSLTPPPPPRKKKEGRKKRKTQFLTVLPVCEYTLWHCVSYVVLCCRCRMVAIRVTRGMGEVLFLNIH